MTYEELKRAIEGLDEESKFFAKPVFEAIEKDPKNPQPYMRLSEIFWKAGKTEIAAEILEMFLDVDPQNEMVRRKLDWIRNFGTRPTAIAGKAEEEAKERKYELIARMMYVVIGVAALIFILFLIKWFLFKPTYRIAKGKENFIAAKFSPDGTKIAYLAAPYFSIFDAPGLLQGEWPKDASLIVSDIRGKSKKEVTKLPVYPFERPTYGWLSDGRLAVGPSIKQLTQREITSIDIQTGVTRVIAPSQEIWISPDGKYFCYLLSVHTSGLYSVFDKELMLVAPDGMEYTIDKGMIGDVSLSNDASVVVYTKRAAATYRDLSEPGSIYRSTLYAYLRDTGRTVKLTGELRYITDPVVSPDGREVAFINYPASGVRELIVTDLEGDQTVIFRTSDDFPQISSPVFSPDGRYLVFDVAMAKSIEARKDLSVKLPQVEKRLKAMQELAKGPLFSMWTAVSDLFYVDLAQAEPVVKRLEIKNHRFKTNASFHPSGELIAFEIMTVDFRTETWISKFKPE